jgi:hypothetical protein
MTNPLRPTTRIFIFQLNTCGYSPSVTSSLTRGWVCRLQLLLIIASAVILRSESCVTHDHILLSQIRDSPNLQGQIPVFISHGPSRNPVSNSNSIISSVVFAAGTCLPIRCLVTGCLTPLFTFLSCGHCTATPAHAIILYPLRISCD